MPRVLAVCLSRCWCSAVRPSKLLAAKDDRDQFAATKAIEMGRAGEAGTTLYSSAPPFTAAAVSVQLEHSNDDDDDDDNDDAYDTAQVRSMHSVI